MKAPLMAAAALAALSFAACSGGGGASTGGSYVAPTQAPGPVTPASQPMLGTASVSGSNAQVYQSSANQHTLYTFAGDAAKTSNCTSANGCSGVWPPYTAPSGTSASSLSAGFGLITRSDGSLQYTYQSFPLYTYTGDSSAGTATGQGLNISQYPGVWSAARPATATPAPGSSASPNPCTGYYCG